MKARIALQQSGAPVPTKNGIVVVGRVNCLSLRKAEHRLGEQWHEAVRRATHAHLSFSSPFVQEPGVIKALVALDESLEKFFRFPMAVRRISAELVGDGEAQQTESKLMPGVDCEDIAADGFCFFRFIE